MKMVFYVALAAAISFVGWAPSWVTAEISQAKPEEDKPEGQLAAEAVDAVWALIDVNQDNQATDVEVYNARRNLRVLANSPEASPVRDAIRERYNVDGDDLVSTDEAFDCMAEVRALRCPIAQRAIAYWQSLDTDGDEALSSEEVRAVINPLGRVGRAMSDMLSNTLGRIDRDDDGLVEKMEVSRRANAMLLVQLATTGDRISNRDPEVWIRYVYAVANLDQNADNTISKQESRAVSQLSEHFDRADKNNDDSLTVSELCDHKKRIDAAIAAAAAARRSRHC